MPRSFCCWLGVVLLTGCSLTLGVDELSQGDGSCADRPASDPCHPIDDLTPGSVGSGIALPWVGLPRYEVVGGVVHAGELVVAVRVRSNDPKGALLGVDVQSGARRLLSGWVTDAQGTPTEAGSGSYVGDLRAISEDGNGYLLHSWQGFDFSGRLYRVNPDTGERSYLGDIGKSGCPDAVAGPYWPDDIDSLVLDASAALLSTSGFGFAGAARVNADGCTSIPIDRDGPFLFARRTADVVIADTKTGALGTLTNDAPSWIGQDGVAVRAFTVSGAVAWLYRPTKPPSLTRVMLDTNERTTTELGVGPARVAPERRPHLWPHPDGKRLLLELDGAIVTVDPASGHSRTLSY